MLECQVLVRRAIRAAAMVVAARAPAFAGTAAGPFAPSHHAPEEACGSMLPCLEQYRGLLLHSIADMDSGIAKTWREATLHYRLRAAGPVVYDYGQLVCHRWLYGTIQNRLFGTSFSDIALAGVVVAVILVALGLQSSFIAKSLMKQEDQDEDEEEEEEEQDEKANTESKPRSRTWRMPVARVARAFSWLAFTVSALPMSMFAIELQFFNRRVDAWCSGTFGPESGLDGRPEWVSFLLKSTGAQPQERFALFSQFVGYDDDYDVELADPSEPDRDPGHEGLIAATLKAYTVSGSESLAVAAACDSFGAHTHTRAHNPQTSPAEALLHRWLKVGGFECHPVVTGERATLFVSHSMLHVQRLKLLTPAQGAKVVELAEATAAEFGWTTARHSSYATTDLPVKSSRELSAYMAAEGIRGHIASKVSSVFGVPQPELWGVESDDWFVAKYSLSCQPGLELGCGQSKLDTHEDGEANTVLTYNVLLNDAREFSGGGTFLEEYSATAPGAAGMSITFASKLRHGGTEIVNGTRYVLVGFMAFNSAKTPFSRAVRDFGNSIAVRAPDMHRFIMDDASVAQLACLTVVLCLVLLAASAYCLRKAQQQ